MRSAITVNNVSRSYLLHLEQKQRYHALRDVHDIERGSGAWFGKIPGRPKLRWDTRAMTGGSNA